ncbi:MAG: extracellular solute-binding protein [Clostridia bacterium]|nr:extracellular solute-binding protein [Clostridia bacterium]
MKRILSLVLSLLMVLSCMSFAAAEDHPDTWIADRTIRVQVYVDDIGYSLPKDLNETPVMKKITELTGIKLEIGYTPGDSDSKTLAAQLAAGKIPDAIFCYLNNSTRKEFPILLKAAREGMFADVTEFMKNSKVYKKYMEEGYLPGDAYTNITFRDDLDGAYIMQLAIPAVDRSTEYIPEDEYVGGLYIQKSIADALGVDTRAINTQDQLYDLLVKIKEGGFTDDNGNPVYPIGPKYWGGSVDSLQYLVTGLNFSPLGSDYGMDAEGHVKHEAETEFVYEKINFVRKLLAEGLMNPEYFTMDATRAEEVSKTRNSAILGDVHNYVDIIYDSDTYVPLGPLNDRTGKNPEYTSGKGGYGAWAISADAEKPEEIFAFFDWLSTYEGQLISMYGVEGLTYNMVDGKPVLTDEAMEKLNSNDQDWMINEIGAGFGGSGCYFFEFALTDRDNQANFGESRPGATGGTTFARAVDIARDYPVEKVLVPGLDISAYLSDESLADVKANMDLLNYDEMLVQAMYAQSDDEVTAIVESFRQQLKSAGIDRLYEHVEKLYAENPSAVQILKVD